MKSRLALSILCVFSAQAFAEDAAMSTQQEKFSYTLGYQLGKDFKDRGISVDSARMLQGVQEGIAGTASKLTQEDMQGAMQAAQQEVTSKAAATGEVNKKAGEDFLAANKTKEGVVVLPSGLQYKILTEGKGKKPLATDTIVANYRGTLIDGTEFDSSYTRGEPATFPVNGVIQGWQEILPMMPEGSKWQVYIPANLAYGDTGAGGQIGPGSALVFDIELISINPAAPVAEIAPPAPATPAVEAAPATPVTEAAPATEVAPAAPAAEAAPATPATPAK